MIVSLNDSKCVNDVEKKKANTTALATPAPKNPLIMYSKPPQSADSASLRLALCYTPFGPIYYIQ